MDSMWKANRARFWKRALLHVIEPGFLSKNMALCEQNKIKKEKKAMIFNSYWPSEYCIDSDKIRFTDYNLVSIDTFLQTKQFKKLQATIID